MSPMISIRLEDIAQLRYALYRFLAASFLAPEEERLEQLDEAAGILEAYGAFLQHFAFYGPWRRWVGQVRRLRLAPHEREVAYTELLQVVPLQASRYLDPEGWGQGRVLLELERAYREAGLRPSSEHLLPPDHLVVELEFMAFLCYQESRAWAESGPISRLLSFERRFLIRHLRRWIPPLACKARAELGANLYRAAVEAVEAYIFHDGDWVTLVASLDPSRGMKLDHELKGERSPVAQ
ncbi:Chlorate reductase assembly chaperone protein [Candidatus Thermoflexus japonica]|uniref:Chlorate reductase assembly chaperone protein n=1 Tax=Candidatus Thermoflexus japonica TaxID=2035417 RepID=A0A2H5Y7E1_9CHLR|nr:Chlorate reductase assembly chaperone protein [Candidatus Thermoflexus japonica]